MPQFSIIIPVYNKETFIGSTLQSVLNQTYQDFEVLVINDGSTDESEAKIKEFSDRRIKYYLTENKGVSAARNLGLEVATADFVTFLDADDRWKPDFLMEMWDSIQAYPEQKIHAAAIEVETENAVFPAQYSIVRSAPRMVVNYFDASLKTTAICTSCAAFSRSVFKEVGNFDEQIKSGQDTDMWIRLGLHYPVVFTFKILARYVYDPNSLSKRKEYLNQKMNFSKFDEVAKSNPKLKRFLDLNTYSFAIRSKIAGDQQNFKLYYKRIDKSGLPFRKRILLQLPALFLHVLIKINLILVNLKLRNSAF